MSDSVPESAVNLVTQFEGFRSHPYRCPAGVWTIGYGSTRDMAGNPVTANTPPIGEPLARMLARRDLVAAAKVVAQDVHVPLSDTERGALDDFIYNLGSGAFRSSTLLQKLNRGDYAGAAAEFDRWDHAAGRVLAGLLRRREAETQLFTEH